MTKAQATVKKLQDPFYFLREVLGIKTLTAEQNQIIDSVFTNKYTGVRSSHNTGKTFICAGIVLAFVIPNKMSQAVTTAPTGRQVKDLLWAEINHLYHNAKYPLGGQMNLTEFKIKPKWGAVGITTEPGKEADSAVKFQGYHSGKILVVLDEAVGIANPIWEAIDGIASNEDAHILAIANPSTTVCSFYKKLKEPDWNELSISSLNHPNVTEKKEIIRGAVSYKYVKEKVGKWCDEAAEHDKALKTFDFEGKIYKPNSLFTWKVLGEFPEQATDTLLSFYDVEKASERELSETGDCYLGIDVARFGSDYSVFCIEKNRSFTFKPFYHFDTAQITGEAIKIIKEHKPKKVGVDCDGIGSGVYDNLNELKNNGGFDYDFELIEIHGGAEPLDLGQTEEFLNLRAQMFWTLRGEINAISLEPIEELQEGLPQIQYKYNSKGKIQIEAKEDFKKRLGRSSDYEDALVYCNFLKYMETEIKMFFIK